MQAMTRKLALVMVAAIGFGAAPALAYDGTNCKEPGNCWEPKPGYPEKVEGSEYDPQPVSYTHLTLPTILLV